MPRSTMMQLLDTQEICNRFLKMGLIYYYQIAEYIGKDKKAVSRALRGKRVRPETVEAIAKALDTSAIAIAKVVRGE